MGKKLVLAGALALLPAASAHAVLPHDPIVFVHGYSGWGGNWSQFVNWFKADGWVSDELYQFSYNSTGDSNQTSASKLGTYIQNVLVKTGASRVDIIAHSNGGLVARWYMAKLGGSAKVNQFVAIGTPHKGTDAAYLCLSPACFEMRPGSTFLKNLGSKECERSLWSSCDEIINPDSSAQCGSSVHVGCIGHLALLGSSSVYAKARDYVLPK
ncbi:MAG: esterase/lipase family protein [Candidatus Binatia bacterium]